MTDNGNIKILVVDDNTINLKLVRNLLAPYGYHAKFVISAKRALESIEVSKPDLILLDITMPEMNGFELCSLLKAQTHTKDIPIIFLSALDGEQDVVKGFYLGGVDYVTKPFKEEILLARVKTHLTQRILKQELVESNNELSHEIEKRKTAQKHTQRSERRLSAALIASNEGIWEWLPELDDLFLSPTFFSMLGYDEDQFSHSLEQWRDLIHPDEQSLFWEQMHQYKEEPNKTIQLEYRIKTSDDEYIWVITKGCKISVDGQGVHSICGTNTNIDKQKSIEHKLKRLVSYDFLTGLPNRLYLTELLTKNIAFSNRNKQKLALLFLDLDRFKNINDSLGHASGDLLLQKVSQRLLEVVREEDSVSRLGGDEFTVFLSNLETSDRVVDVAERILEAFKKPFNIQGHQVVIGPSIGIAIYPDDANSVEDILKKADSAMYRAKRKGRTTFSFFTEDMNEIANNRLRVEENLRRAIQDHDLVAYYQPKYNLINKEFCGMESLCRWHKNDEIILPYKFMNVAHETGLILAIDCEMLKQAAIQTKLLHDQHIFKGRVAVNISPLNFKRPDFLNVLDKILEETQLPPELMELEITEEAIVEDIEHAVRIMDQLKSRGISLALDDFGTGYSSLSYLKRFPIDTLKIDMSFISEIHKSEKTLAIVKCITDLAHTLNISVVAEGVENEQQLHLLEDIGCDYIQGYYFSRPIAEQQLYQNITQKGFAPLIGEVKNQQLIA